MIDALTMTSLFAGVGGFDLGFEEAGIKVVAHVERDPACQKLLKARWPDAVALDDVCTAGAHNLPKSNIICAGFPCQDVSVAGQRAGLAGNRSGLFYQFTRIAHELQSACLVWENVYGLLSSNKGHDFLAILAEFRRIGYHGGWRTFDAQYFGVAQRRRRIFGVFTRGDIGIECAIQILSLREGVRGHPAPRREKGQKVAGTVRGGTASGSNEPENKIEIPEVAKTLDAGRDSYNDGSDQTYLPSVVGTLDTFSGCDRKIGNQQIAADQVIPCHEALPQVAWTLQERDSKGSDSDTKEGHLIVAFQPRIDRNGRGQPEPKAFTCSAQSNGFAWESDVAPTIDTMTPNDTSDRQKGIRMGTMVRRLTPTECERLQGFPDGHTKDFFSDSTRYKMLGNAVCVKNASWLGKRIVAFLPPHL